MSVAFATPIARRIGAVRVVSPRVAQLRCTLAFVGTLVGVWVTLQVRPTSVPGIVNWTSTNVHNLASHPLAAMVTSAFVTDGDSFVNLTLAGLACGIVESRLGVRRTLAIALAGHVLATLLTEYGAAGLAALHLTGASSPERADVGVSYVMYALLAAATLLLPPRLRFPVFGLSLLSVALPFARAPGMTTTGHVLSFGLGVATLALLRARTSAAPQPPSGELSVEW